MSMKVNDFKYIHGENDAEYIELLRNALERQKQITNKAIAKIKELSNCSETPNKWIPCSERLPEEKKGVLISADGELYIAELETINGERFWSEVVEYRYIWNVDAWMPLPEPWKGKKDDSKSDEQLSYM